MNQHRVTLLNLYQKHICNTVKLTGTEFAHNTVRRYRSSLNSLNRYMNGNDIELSNLGLKFVRDYFTFLLTVENLQPNSDGKEWIFIDKVKTDNRCAIPLLPIALEILKKYDYKLPKVSNPYQVPLEVL
jgi:Phage integrase SAM-like domain